MGVTHAAPNTFLPCGVSWGQPDTVNLLHSDGDDATVTFARCKSLKKQTFSLIGAKLQLRHQTLMIHCFGPALTSICCCVSALALTSSNSVGMPQSSQREMPHFSIPHKAQPNQKLHTRTHAHPSTTHMGNFEVTKMLPKESRSSQIKSAQAQKAHCLPQIGRKKCNAKEWQGPKLEFLSPRRFWFVPNWMSCQDILEQHEDRCM